MSLCWVWHLYNLPCVSVLFWLISIARYVFKSPSVFFWGPKYDVYCECVANLHSKLWHWARLWLELFASTVDRILSRVSYLPSDTTFFFGDTVALLRESYTFVQRNSHVFLAFSDGAYVSGARCIGFFLDSSRTTGFKFNSLRASLLTVLRVVYKTMVSILHVDLISCRYC